MGRFSRLPLLGHYAVDLDEVPSEDEDQGSLLAMTLAEGLSEAETIPASPATALAAALAASAPGRTAPSASASDLSEGSEIDCIELQDSEFAVFVDEASSEVETKPGSPVAAPAASACAPATPASAQTAPATLASDLHWGSVVECIEVIHSDSEVEIVYIQELPKPLTPEEEIQKMGDEERYGHFHRVELRESGVQHRVRRVSEGIARETPEQRRVRKRTFREQVHGEGWSASV